MLFITFYDICNILIKDTNTNQLLLKVFTLTILMVGHIDGCMYFILKVPGDNKTRKWNRNQNTKKKNK